MTFLSMMEENFHLLKNFLMNRFVFDSIFVLSMSIDVDSNFVDDVSEMKFSSIALPNLIFLIFVH